MKNIYIGGTTRSGKSTLTLKLHHELGYSIFEMDTIVHSFTKVFPNLGINEKNHEDLDENFRPFAYEILKCCDKDRKYGNVKMVINGCHLSPKSIYNSPVRNDLMVIFLGMGEVTPEYLFKCIKQTQSNSDWTYDKKDTTLLAICNNIVNESRNIKQECKKFGFLYFDTCIDRGKVLQNILEYIKENN